MHVPPEMLAEIRAEATRLDVAISTLMRRVWRIARHSVASLPASDEGISLLPESSSTREALSYDGVDYEFAIHPDGGGASVYVRDPLTGLLRHIGTIDRRSATHFPGVEAKHRPALHVFAARRWPAKREAGRGPRLKSPNGG